MTAEGGWRRLGAVLVDAGLLREVDLAEALAEKERSGDLLGTILVRRGLVSGPAVANALAEQHGGYLKSEHGFGTGLQDTDDTSDPGPPPVSVSALAEQETPPATHLLFVPTAQGYLLLQREGVVPEIGDQLELTEPESMRLVVVKVASSPLPADSRACAYLQEV